MAIHPLFSRFKTFHGYIPHGFEAWFFGVQVRDWLFTGVSKNLPGGVVSVGYPPLNNEYFEWLGLMAALATAEQRFTIVEVGAGWGRWLVAAAKLAEGIGLPFMLAGVEADPDHFQWMQDVFRDNGLDPARHALSHFAAAAQNGTGRFLRHRDPRTHYDQQLAGPSKDIPGIPQGFELMDTEAKSLAEILAPFPRVDFLSLDVQGAEMEILQPAMASLDRVRVLQVHTNTEAIEAALAALFEPKDWTCAFRFTLRQQQETPYGKVMFDRGLQTWVHPAAAGEVMKLMQKDVRIIYPMTGVPGQLPTGGGGLGVFDTAEAHRINQARMNHLASLNLPVEGRSVLDVGAGVGHLAQYFVSRGCKPVCVDARAENIAMLQSRYPELTAYVANVESDSLARFGRFDIVFCYGLLYHPENPIAALRNIAAVCSDMLLLETVITDHPEPLAQLADEPSETLSQAVGGLATRPTPAFIAMALTRAGFPFIYAPKSPPLHPDFQFQWEASGEYIRDGHLLRCIFIASRRPIDNPALSLQLYWPDADPHKTPAIPVAAERRIWVDAMSGWRVQNATAARQDPSLIIYEFEPDLAAAVRRMGLAANLAILPLEVANAGAGSIRLDRFLDQASLSKVELLKAPAMNVVRTAGARLADFRRVALPMDTCEEAEAWMIERGFELVSFEDSDHPGGAIATFARVGGLYEDPDLRMLRRARTLFQRRELTPYPGWHFDIDWDCPLPEVQARRAIWEAFRSTGKIGPLPVEWYYGVRLITYLGNDLSKQLFVTGCIDPNEFVFLNDYLTPGMTFVDAGANEGLYSIFAASRVGETGGVYAFEPSARELKRLRHNCELNRFQQIQIFDCALMSGTGAAALAIAESEHAGQNTFGLTTDRLHFAASATVSTRALDDIAASQGWKRIDVLKLDVEGAEIRLLEGAARVIASMRPLILFECSAHALACYGGNPDELLGLLKSHGYLIYRFDPDTGLPAIAQDGQYSDNMIAAMPEVRWQRPPG